MNTTDTPSDNQGGRRTYVVAAVLAALAGLLAYSSITQRRAEVERGWEPTPVLVAARDIPGGTVLDQDMLRVEAIPSRLVTPSIVRSDLLASVQDAKLLLPMKQGDLLNFNMLQFVAAMVSLYHIYHKHGTRNPKPEDINHKPKV